VDHDLRAYLSLTAASLKMYVRNPIASSSLFIVLILLLVAFRVVFSGPGPTTKVVIVDGSSSPEAATLVKDIRAVAGFDVGIAATEAAARSKLDAGQADIAIVIPEGFPARSPAGDFVPVQLQVVYRAGTAGQSSLPVLTGIVETFNEASLGAVPPVSVAPHALHTRVSSVVDVLLPGLVAFNIIGGALMVAAGVFSNYKSTGVLRRLKATGIRPTVFVLAHATSSFLVGMVQAAAILVVAALLFGVHLDLPALFALLALGYLVFLAMGLTISGWVRDPQRASGVAQSVAMPMIFIALLSAAIPPAIAAFTNYLPGSYIVDGMQRVSQGGDITSVGMDLAWLGGWSAVLLVAAGRAFRWD
jgi:ABC-2 type transport system permease protein